MRVWFPSQLARGLNRAWAWAQRSPWLRAAGSALGDQTPILAAGTALYAILAFIPTLAGVVSLVGLIADPHRLEAQLMGLERILPRAVVSFLADQLRLQADKPSGDLSLALAMSVALALYSARSAVAALVLTLNRAYRVRDRRSALHRLLLTMLFALGTLVGLVVFLFVVVALPAWTAVLPIATDTVTLAATLRWPVMFVAVLGMYGVIYRVLPAARAISDGGAPRLGHVIWPGAWSGTVIWLAASWGLSRWVDQLTDYTVFYGSFATVIIVLLWFWISVQSAIVGGFINAEIERARGAEPPSASMW